jgi:hypothetical protein
MNRKSKIWQHPLRFLTMLALLSGMVALSGPLHAWQTSSPSEQQYPTQQQPQQQPGQTPDQSGQKAAPDSQDQSQQPGVQVFTGVIAKSGDKYVLQDSASGNTYDIDHQEQVKQFEGKKVRVHGTLDSSGKMIHVQ